MAILKKLCFDSSCDDLPFHDYYTKAEIQDLIHGLEGLTVVIVDQLPATGEANTMYFVENGNVYDEYMYIAGQWEALGSTGVDLSGYVTTTTHNADIQAIHTVDGQQNGKITTLENDVDALETALTNKQDKLTAGSNISISGNTISANLSGYVPTTTFNTTVNTINAKDTAQDGRLDTLEDCCDDVQTALTNKQDKLTAGTNVTISGNTISATDTKYTAGTNVAISSGNVISATDTTYTAGENITISPQNVISATGGGGGSYVAGDNITISGNTISATDTKYTAGSGLSLSGTTFSAKTGYTTSGNNRGVKTDSSGNLYVTQKDTTYSAGTYITINSSNQISVNLTKANLLSILGYEETTLEITDTLGGKVTKKILVKA